MRNFIILFVVSMALSLWSTNLLANNENATHPNILIILVDDMGYGDLGCYNKDSKIPAPHIDSLARDGMRFTDAHAAGTYCHPSRYGLLTGEHPFRVNTNKWPKHAVIDEERLTIAGMLKQKNYRTAMVGKWHLGFEENGYENKLPGGPFNRGFDSFFGIRASTDIPHYFYIRNDMAVKPPTVPIEANYSDDGWTKIQGAFWRKGLIAEDMELKDVLPRFTNEAIKVIENHASHQKDKEYPQPLMMYLAYPAPHTPWLPSDEFIGKSKAGMYGDFTMMVDANVGRVLDALKSTGMDDNTLVIFSSDNGPVWYDKDVKRFSHDSSGGLRGMKSDAYEGGHRMPFLVRWPGVVKAGSVSHELICFTDVMATLAAITGYELKDADAPDSFDFSRVLKGKQPEGINVRPHLVINAGGQSMAVRRGPWKYINHLGSGGFTKPSRVKPGPDDPPGQLYNLNSDQGETKNLYLDHPEIVEQLIKILDETVENARTR